MFLRIFALTSLFFLLTATASPAQELRVAVLRDQYQVKIFDAKGKQLSSFKPGSK